MDIQCRIRPIVSETNSSNYSLKAFLKKIKNVKNDLKIALKLQMPFFFFLFEICRFK